MYIKDQSYFQLPVLAVDALVPKRHWLPGIQLLHLFQCEVRCKPACGVDAVEEMCCTMAGHLRTICNVRGCIEQHIMATYEMTILGADL